MKPTDIALILATVMATGVAIGIYVLLEGRGAWWFYLGIWVVCLAVFYTGASIGAAVEKVADKDD